MYSNFVKAKAGGMLGNRKDPMEVDSDMKIHAADLVCANV